MALPVSTVVVLGALSALSAVVYGQDGINQNAAAMPLAYGNSSVGPDGKQPVLVPVCIPTA